MLKLILNNRTVNTSLNAGMTLLDFIRYEQNLTGTKIGCREGDCGACTVLVGTLSKDGYVNYESITSCISPLGNAHGKHIVTVEGINSPSGLTKAQSTMKENYATQCGFCTPGFVVSLTGFALSDKEKTTENALKAISGNICRCTGYKSIERAANSLCAAVDNLNTQEPDVYLSELIDKGVVPSYFVDISDRLRKLKDIEEEQEEGKYVAGGTDLYVQQAHTLSELSVHLIANDPRLKGIEISGNRCVIGSGTTVTELSYHEGLKQHFPNLLKHLKLVSSEPIRNMASLGGNFINASPIGDMTIFFLALDSIITLKDQKGQEREVPFKEFYKGYKTFDLKEKELVKSISFELPSESTHFNFEKVCKRTHLDIASVNSAIRLEVEEGIVIDAHIAVGGVAAIPKYLHETSSFLKSKKLSIDIIVEANEVLQNEISPISDVRGSSEYKRLLARQLFFAHFTELFSEDFQLNEILADESK